MDERGQLIHAPHFTVKPGCVLNEKYSLQSVKGEGSNAVVWIANSIGSDSKYAIKQITFSSSEDVKRTCREIRLLKYFRVHPHIINLFDILRPRASSKEVFLVLELMDTDLAGFMKLHGILSYELITTITHQILLALNTLHRSNVVHRDIKPQNVLIMITNPLTVKLCDFGTGRLISPNRALNVSSLIETSTLFYCAPEGLLHQNVYFTSVDMWALGCIMVEMISNTPLLNIKKKDFRTIEKCLLEKMVDLCGTPSHKLLSSFPDSEEKKFLMALPERTSPLINQILQNVEPKATILVKGLLTFDPLTRLTAKDALQLDIFKNQKETVPGASNFSFNEEIFGDPVTQKGDISLWTAQLQQEIHQFHKLN